MKANLLELLITFFMFVYCAKHFCFSFLYLIQESELLEKFRAYIETKYSKTKIEYLINCPFCLSYWICLFMSTMFFFVCIFLGLQIIIVFILSILLWITCTGIVVNELKNKS